MEPDNYIVTYSLIAANAIISLIALNNRQLMQQAIMWPYGVKNKKEYYRFISSGFLHADIIHLFFNMFTLYFFGKNIELIFSAFGLGGKISYLILYFGALVVSDIPTYIKHRDNPSYFTLGASGAVSAVVFSCILFSPWASIYLYGAIRISAAVYAVLYLIYCIYMAKKSADNVNHDAHLWGAVFGFAFTLILIGAIRPELYYLILEQLKNPSFFGY